MEKVLNQILETLKELKDGQDAMQTEVSDINRKVSVIFDQTANLTEFTTDTTDRLERIEIKITGLEQEMSTIEKVTAKNCFDITHLKAIK